MKTRAAVAFEAKKPLEIVELDLEGPKAGEVLVEIKATGICHTDAYTLDGFDSEGIFPSILGHEGAGIVREVGAGVTLGEAGRSRDPALHAGMPAVQKLPEPEDQSVHRDPRHPGQGRDAGRHLTLQPTRASRSSTTWAARRSRTSPCCRRSRSPKSARTRRSTRAATSAAASLPASAPWSIPPRSRRASNVVVFGLGGIGLNVIQGAKMVGADKIVGVDINDSKEDWGRRFGMTHFVNPTKIGGDIVQHLVDTDRRRRRLHLRLHRQYQCDAPGAGSCHRGWGVSVIIGVAEAGKEIATRPFQLVTGRVWKGTAFGGARGRTDVPKIVDWYMNGKIQIDPMITHVLKLEEINKGFDLMHEGKSIRSRRRVTEIENVEHKED